MYAHERPPSRAAAIATFAVLTLIWGTTWAAIRIGLQGIPPLAGVAMRFAIAAGVLGAVGIGLGVRFGATTVERRLWWVNGLLSFCASYGLVYWAEQWVPSGLASVLFATFPLLVALLAHAALPGERLTVPSAIGTALGFAGVATIFSEDFARLGGRDVAFAAVVLLIAPLVSAIASVAVKKWGRAVHPLSITAVPMAIAAGVMGGLSLALERERAFHWTAVSVAALLYLAIAGSAVTFSLYYWLLTHLPATRMSMIAYTSPVVAVFVGAAWLGEPVTLRMLTGSALVLAGVALATRRRRASGRER